MKQLTNPSVYVLTTIWWSYSTIKHPQQCGHCQDVFSPHPSTSQTLNSHQVRSDTSPPWTHLLFLLVRSFLISLLLRLCCLPLLWLLLLLLLRDVGHGLLLVLLLFLRFAHLHVWVIVISVLHDLLWLHLVTAHLRLLVDTWLAGRLNTSHTTLRIIHYSCLNTSHTTLRVVCYSCQNTSHTLRVICYSCQNTSHTTLCVICYSCQNTCQTALRVICYICLTTSHTTLWVNHYSCLNASHTLFRLSEHKSTTLRLPEHKSLTHYGCLKTCHTMFRLYEYKSYDITGCMWTQVIQSWAWTWYILVLYLRAVSAITAPVLKICLCW